VHEVDGFLLGQVQAVGRVGGGRGHSDTLGEAGNDTEAPVSGHFV
jgi:hypothetical protein